MNEQRTFWLAKQIKSSETAFFVKLLDSPIFNKKAHLRPLFEAIRKSNGPRSAAPEALFSRAFGEKPFEKRAFENAMSDLNKLIEQFFVIIDQFDEAGALDFRLLLVEKMARLGPGDALGFAAALKKARATLDTAPERADLFARRLWLDRTEILRADDPAVRADSGRLKLLEAQLDQYYLLSKMQFAANRLGQIDAEEAAFLNRLRCSVEAEKGLPASALLRIYARFFDLFRADSLDLKMLAEADAFFWNDLQKLDANEAEMAVRHLLNLFDHARSKFKLKTSKLSLKTYQKARAAGLFENARGEAFLLRIGLFTAAEGQDAAFNDFLKTLPDDFADDRKPDAECLFRAYRLFFKGKMEAAEKALAPFSRRLGILYTLRFHSIRLRILAELFVSEADDTADERLEAEANHFATYVRREKSLSPTERTGYKNLVAFARQLLKPDKSYQQDLLKTLKKKPSAHLDWAIEIAQKRPKK